MNFSRIKSFLLGRALSDDQISHEKLSVFWGLPIMSSDAISSVAYGVEEILLALILPIGMLAVNVVWKVGPPILILLLLLVFSFTQIINHYPNGGGSYIVTKENFGRRPALLAASCLVVDYIMTVAVSVSSSTAAIAAMFPVLEPYKVLISLVCLSLITLMNLRGISESSKVFGMPTYLFILSMVITIIAGLIKVKSG